MRKTFKLVLFTALIVPLFAACGGGSSAGKLVDHMDKIVSLLEKNAKDPAKAETVVSAYLKDNQEAMQKLATDMSTKIEAVQKEMAEKMKNAKPEDMAGLAQEMMEKSGFTEDMMKRAQELDARREKVMKDNPDLAKNDKLMAQLDTIEKMMKK